LQNCRFDLVLLDMMMPEISGLQILEYLKSDPHLRHVPAIVISALDEKATIVACIEQGAEDYLSKPYDPVILKARLNACLEKKLLRDREEFHRQRLEDAYKELEQAYKELEELKNNLEMLSRRDGLTGLSNRTHFDRVLAQEWKVATRNREPFSLILFDIDYFKQYNDTYGHLNGDECLRQVSRVAEQAARRPRDTAARYGGEEFAVILPDTDAAGAVAIADKLRHAVEALDIPHERSNIAPYVTISLGVATAIASTEMSLAKLLESADAALYRAKHEGRNCVKAWTESCVV
jgi:diguanylate cyclase (GGDEF)-like protein